MSFFPRLSVKNKFVLIIMSISSLSLLLALISIASVGINLYKNDLAEHVEHVTTMLAVNVAPALLFADKEASQRALKIAEEAPNIIFAAAYDLENKIVAKLTSIKEAKAKPRKMVSGTTIHGDYIEAIKAVVFNDIIVGHVVVRLDISVLTDRVKLYVFGSVIAFLLSFLLILILSSLIHRIISKPIEQLINVANQISNDGNYYTKIEHSRQDEFGVLLNAFNDMMSTIAKRDEMLLKTSKMMIKEKDEAEYQREAAEKASMAKSEFLSSMSHELRTPLNAILGFAQLLEMDAKESLNAEQSENVHYILESGHHLLKLINQVLELAKVEAGQMDLSIEKVLTEDVIKECLPLIQSLADTKQIEIMIKQKHCQIMMMADHTKLKQILINLMSNAIKYNRQGGSVTIECQLFENTHLKILIADTGIGIPHKQQGQVFTAFSRLGQENSTIEGAGVGLVVTKRLVEAMSGQMGFESTEGEGSCFWFTLPIADDTKEATPYG